MNRRTTLFFLTILLISLANVPLTSGTTLGRWENTMPTDPNFTHEYPIVLDQDGALTLTLSGADSMRSQYANVTVLDANRDEIRYPMLLMELPATQTYYLGPGEYTLRVGKYRSDIYGHYVLEADFQPTSPESIETPGNDTSSGATGASSGATIYGSIGHWLLRDKCDTQDWFVFRVSSDGELRVEVDASENLKGSQYFEVNIRDNEGERIGLRSAAHPEPLKIQLTAGTYYVQVFIGRTDLHGSYNVRLQFSPEGSPQPEDKFVYTIKNPRESSAQRYLVRQSNVQVHTEGNFTFWSPVQGSTQEQSTVPGILIYHFPFSEPITGGTLFVRTTSFHWDYSQGHGIIYLSPDGSDWHKVAEAVTPEYAHSSFGIFDASLPGYMVGHKDIYLKVELYSFGPSADQGNPWTNTSQHLRYDASQDNITLKLEVETGETSSTSSGIATYDNNTMIMHTPCVEVGSSYYWGNFKLESGMPLLLRLMNYGLAQEMEECAFYNLATNQIHVPKLSVNDKYFTLDLVPTEDGRFSVENLHELNR